MAFTVNVKLDLPRADELIKNVGLDKMGPIQRFHDQNVLRRMQKYMPYKSGAFIKTTITNTVIGMGEIVSVGPHAAFLYKGKVMVGDKCNSPWARKGETKHVAEDWDIDYNKEKNPQAGPYWDKALVANEGDVLVSELQSYINYLAGRNK